MSSSEEEEFDIYYNTHEDPNLEMGTNYENIQGKNLEKSMQSVFLGNISSFVKYFPNRLHDFVNLEKLELSSIENNILTKDIFSSLINLKLLSLSELYIEDLTPGIFDSLVNLQELNLSINQLSTLDGDLFKNQKNLLKLDLSGNHLEYLAPDIFDNLEKLIYLDFNCNSIKKLDNSIFKNLFKLEYLDLSECELKEIESFCFQNLNKLLQLKLNNNPELEDFYENSFTGLQNLKVIDVSNIARLCDIKTPMEVFDKLPNLEQFINNNNEELYFSLSDLENCFNLRMIDTFSSIILSEPHTFNNLVNLEILRYDRPEFFDRQTFKNLVNLQELYIREFCIHQFNQGIDPDIFNDNINLRKISLTKTNFKSIDEQIFKNQEKLEYLNFYDNYFESIPDNLFSNQKCLKYINLSLSNNLKEIPKAVKKVITLQTILF